MLSFVDQERNVKVFRITAGGDGGAHRERLGVLPKKDLAPGDDLQNLPDDEKAELDAAIDFYRKSAEAKVQAALYSFPETVRLVTERVAQNGGEFDRKIVLTALLEGLRQLRRQERAPAAKKG
jgi:hypothetical protein